MSEQMVEVIGPHGVHSKAIFRERRDDRVEIPVILGNEISSEARVECFNALGKFREEVFRTVVDQRMCGVKAQTVEVEETLRSEEHTSELQSRGHLVCRLLLEEKKKVECIAMIL